MSDRFHEAVLRVRAEQFLQEKRASARGVDAVTYANFVRAAESIEDPALFKLAAFYSPDSIMETYLWLGGKVKVARPAFTPDEAHQAAESMRHSADWYDKHPGVVRSVRGALGGGMGAVAGHAAGKLLKHPGIGAAVGGALGAAGAALPKPHTRKLRSEADDLEQHFSQKK